LTGISERGTLRAMVKQTLTEIKRACSEAHQKCERDWRREFGIRNGMMISRGRYIGVEVQPPEGLSKQVYEGEERPWDGSLRDLVNAINKAARQGKVLSVFIFGGFNYAENLRDYNDGNYDALVNEWEIELERE